MEELARSKIERASEIIFFILPWRHDFLLAPLRHPCSTDLRQQMDIEFISKDQHLMDLQVLDMPANPSQARDSLWIVIFGYQLGPFPHPPQFMEPAPYRPRRHLKTMLGVEFKCQRGTTPACATP